MLRLLILRHAKAAREVAGEGDFERGLTSRGWGDARAVGEVIGAEFPPDLVLCSSARRTRETLAAVLPSLAGELEIKLSAALYAASADDLPGIVAENGGSAGTLMIVGHNPTLEEAVALFCNPSRSAYAAAYDSGLPTAGLAVIEFTGRSWKRIRPGAGKLTHFRRPDQKKEPESALPG